MKKLFTFQICLGFSKLFSILQFVLKIQNLFVLLKIVPISKFCSKILKVFMFTKKIMFTNFFCSQFKICSPFKNIHVFAKITIKYLFRFLKNFFVFIDFFKTRVGSVNSDYIFLVFLLKFEMCSH